MMCVREGEAKGPLLLSWIKLTKSVFECRVDVVER